MAEYEKIVLVTRKTRLAELVERFNTRSQARFYLEHAGQDFEDYAREDDTYRRSLDALHKLLELGLPVQQVDRSLVPTFLFTGKELVVTVGQDGLVANVAKYVGCAAHRRRQPGPRALRRRAAALRRRQGAGGGAPRAGGAGALPRGDARRGGAERRPAAARVQRPVPRGAHPRLRPLHPALRAPRRVPVLQRHHRLHGGGLERLAVLGVHAGPGAHGGNGWTAGPAVAARPGRTRGWPSWCASPSSAGTRRRAWWPGSSAREQELEVESRMPSGGVIFSDGVEEDFLAFNAGTTARVRPAAQRARLVVA